MKVVDIKASGGDIVMAMKVGLTNASLVSH
jgi:hypothetical protein